MSRIIGIAAAQVAPVPTDPEGRLTAEGGNGEEAFIVLLGLDLVSTVREHSAAGRNAPRKQLHDAAPTFLPGLPGLPGYGSGDVMRGLGPLSGPIGAAKAS